jgi:hypothetical protein
MSANMQITDSISIKKSGRADQIGCHKKPTPLATPLKHFGNLNHGCSSIIECQYN